MIGDQEREEFEAIQREEALQKIQWLVRRYEFTTSDLQSILPKVNQQAQQKSERQPTQRFDPFFDAW